MTELVKELAGEIEKLAKNRWISIKDECPRPERGKVIIYYFFDRCFVLRSVYDECEKIYRWLEYNETYVLPKLCFNSKKMRRYGGKWKYLDLPKGI